MAIERSVYEGTFDARLSGQICFGRVISVDTMSKRCRVKTMGVKGKTDDLDIPSCQWMSLTAHPDGDEDTTYPRTGQIGLVIFAGSEPYLVGAFAGIAADNDNPRPSQIPLLEGDKVISTVGGNSIIMRTGGSVELTSSGICRTYWIPSRNLITSVCQNWELEVDGGYLYWDRDPTTKESVFNLFCWETLVNPTTGANLQMGTTDSGAMLDLQIGALGTDRTIQTINFDLTVQKNGDTDLNIGPDNMTLGVVAESGDTTFTTKGKLTETIQQDFTQEIQKGNLIQTIDEGNVTQEVKKGNFTQTITQGNFTQSVKQGDLTQTIDQGALKVTAKVGDVSLEATKGNMTLTAGQMNSVIGKQVFLLKSGAASPYVLGDVLVTTLNNLIIEIHAIDAALAAFAASLASATDPVVQEAAGTLAGAIVPIEIALSNIQATYLTAPATNIISQSIFGDRGEP